MNYRFDATDGLIIVTARIGRPIGIRYLNLALDTGATSSLIKTGRLVAIGYDPLGATNRTQITTGRGVESAAIVTVDSIHALGGDRTEFPVIAHTLPPSAGEDGLHGLDFLRGCQLSVDFRLGLITLS